MEELLRLQPDTLGAAKARGMDATQVAIRDLEAMEAQQGAVCKTAPAEHPTCPGGSNRWQSAWSLGSGQQPGLAVRTSDCLLRCARSSSVAGRALAQPTEPPYADPHVRLVWQGRVGDHSPYADFALPEVWGTRSRCWRNIPISL